MAVRVSPRWILNLRGYVSWSELCNAFEIGILEEVQQDRPGCHDVDDKTGMEEGPCIVRVVRNDPIHSCEHCTWCETQP